MARRKPSKYQFYKFVSMLFAIAAVAMIFLPAVKLVSALSDTSSEKFTGIMVSFGYKSKIGIKVFKFSILNLLPYVATLTAFILIITLSSKKRVIANFTILVVLVLSSILFFLSPYFLIFGEEYYVNTFFELGLGSILAGIFSLLSGLVFLYGMYKN